MESDRARNFQLAPVSELPTRQLISLPQSLVVKIYRFRTFVRISFARLRTHYFQFLGAKIEPKCLMGSGCKLEYPWNISMGRRCVMQANVWLNVGGESARLIIGEYTFVGRNTEIEVAREVIVGTGCLIAPGVFITDHNHATDPEASIKAWPS